MAPERMVGKGKGRVGKEDRKGRLTPEQLQKRTGKEVTKKGKLEERNYRINSLSPWEGHTGK